METLNELVWKQKYTWEEKYIMLREELGYDCPKCNTVDLNYKFLIDNLDEAPPYVRQRELTNAIKILRLTKYWDKKYNLNQKIVFSFNLIDNNQRVLLIKYKMNLYNINNKKIKITRLLTILNFLVYNKLITKERLNNILIVLERNNTKWTSL